MKERLILLAMAYPEISQKYGYTVCMAGITEFGDFKRVYPVPYDLFSKSGFRKRGVIEYEIRDGKEDYRKESQKIIPSSIKILNDIVNYEDIRSICKQKTTTIESLKGCFDRDKTSLGIVKPILQSFKLVEKELDPNNTLDDYMMFPTIGSPEVLSHKMICSFKCGESDHSCSIVDIEVGQLYRKIKDGVIEKERIESKIRDKIMNWMKNTREIYFFMGTAFNHPNHWMILSLLYPKNNEQQTFGIGWMTREPTPVITLSNFDCGK